jgi:hypothetical protein
MTFAVNDMIDGNFKANIIAGMVLSVYPVTFAPLAATL